MLDDVGGDAAPGETESASATKKKRSLKDKRDGVRVKRDASLIRALRVEIAKPLENPDTWNELGAELRRQRAACGRLHRAAFLEYVTAVRHPGLHVDAAGKAIPPSTVAYQEVQREIDARQEWARGKLKTAKESTEDYERLKVWSEFELPGGTKSAIANAAVLKASEWLKKSGDTAIPSFRNGIPIPIRKQEFEIVEEPVEREVDGKVKKSTRIYLSIKLRAGNTGRAKILIRPTKGTHWQALRKIISGHEEKGFAAGALKLVYDEGSRRADGKKGKWFAIISYSAPLPALPESCDPDKMLVVHRGLYSLLTCASSAGTQWKTIDSGHRYIAFKRRILARQKQMNAVPKGERGTGSRGHGRKRRYATYDSLESKIADFRKTYIQQSWSRVVELAKTWGCGTIVIEDYSAIMVEEPRFQIQFPWAELKSWGEYVCKREGLAFVETSSAYISQCCPRCGHTEDSGRQVVRRRGMFHCQRCNFERPLDMVSTIHMLRRAAPKVNEWDIALQKEFHNAKMLGEVKDRGSERRATDRSKKIGSKKTVDRGQE